MSSVLCLLTQAYLVLLHFALLRFANVSFFFIKWRVCDNSMLSKSVDTIFPKHLLFMSLYNVLIILAVFQIFFIVFVMVVCDQWSLMFQLLLFWGATNCVHVRWWPYLINVFWLPHWLAIPLSFCLLGPSYSLRHNNTEQRSVNNPTMISKCSSEKKSFTTFTLNQS